MSIIIININFNDYTVMNNNLIKHLNSGHTGDGWFVHYVVYHNIIESLSSIYMLKG